MSVCAHDAYVDAPAGEDVEAASLDELLARSDIVTLHVPGSSDDRRVLAVLSNNHLRVQGDWWILVWQSRAAALRPVSQQIWTTVTIVAIALLAALAVAIQLRPSRPAAASTPAATQPLEHPEEVSDAMPR